MATFDIHNFLKYNISVGGTGTITLGSVVAGFQGFSNANDGFIYPYSIGDLATHWETGYGTIHMPGATFDRNFITESSSGGAAINVNAGTDQFWCAANSFTELNWNNGANYGMIPGGRLTLTTGVPVTTSDVTGATTIYYTPYISNVIDLFDGKVWFCNRFSETSLALGTLTSGLPYDVFGFSSTYVLALELLAWTNNTTRATSITIQDGKYCKSTDKTRLYLGTIYTTSTTATEDSAANRYVFNMYNRRARQMIKGDFTSHTINNQAAREWNNSTTIRGNFIVGLVEDAVQQAAFCDIATSASATPFITISTNLNGSVTANQKVAPATLTSLTLTLCPAAVNFPALGQNYLTIFEAESNSQTATMSNAEWTGRVWA